MTGEELVEFHEWACERMHDICIRKNTDYAGQKGGADAFANFRMVEYFGIAEVEQGMLTRMSDKFARIVALVGKGSEGQVKDETIQDTLFDFANYCILLAAYLASKTINMKAESQELAVKTDG